MKDTKIRDLARYLSALRARRHWHAGFCRKEQKRSCAEKEAHAEHTSGSDRYCAAVCTYIHRLISGYVRVMGGARSLSHQTRNGGHETVLLFPLRESSTEKSSLRRCPLSHLHLPTLLHMHQLPTYCTYKLHPSHFNDPPAGFSFRVFSSILCLHVENVLMRKGD